MCSSSRTAVGRPADRRTTDAVRDVHSLVARAVPYAKHFTIGNEPNLNRFWLPQFGPDGENVAAPAYLRLLTAAYDAHEGGRRGLRVLGGALAARQRRPALSRHTHSPTKFIKDMGIAYRASGRTKPVMDALSINPFADNSSISLPSATPRTARSVSPTTTSS